MRLCSFELASKLAELRIRIPHRYYYITEDIDGEIHTPSGNKRDLLLPKEFVMSQDTVNILSINPNQYIPAPEVMDVQIYLQYFKNIYISIEFNTESQLYKYLIYIKDNLDKFNLDISSDWISNDMQEAIGEGCLMSLNRYFKSQNKTPLEYS